MTRRSFVAGTLAAPALLSQNARRRNIVFILTDDHRYNMIGAMGHPWLKTPQLDKALATGVHFQNAFVTSSLCSPSRASILTSQYMHSHRVLDNFSPLNPSIPTFPQLLQKNGYRTAFLGKWHMGGDSDEPRPGFSHWVSFQGQGEYNDPTFNVNGNRRKTPGYVTDILTDEAERFIRQKSSTPFMLYLSHKAVHHPFQPPSRHRDLYNREPVPYPETMAYKEERYERWPEWVKRRRYTRHGVDGAMGQTSTFDEFYRDYCKCLASIDESVGRVRTALEESGQLNDTLFVYMGDNGYMWGEHGLVDKRAMYEASIRVPMIAHCPDLFSGGKRERGMVLNLDIGPTFLEAAGIPAPATMQGRSLLPLLADRARDWRTEFLYEYEWERDFPYTPTIAGLRTDRYSLMQYYGLWDLDELYDVAKDPEQIRNLLGSVRIRSRGRVIENVQDPELRNLLSGLQDRMAKLLEQTGGDPRLAGRAVEGFRFAL